MSFVKAGDVLRLALDLQGTASGLTLAEIAAKFGVSRRTAERMRDAVAAATGRIEESGLGGREKRWRLAAGGVGRLAEPNAAEIADVARAAAMARADGLAPLAESLDGLAAKLKAAQRAPMRLRNEPDIEALSESEAFASRPGPRPLVDRAIVATIREAIRRYRRLRIVYRYRGSGRRGWDIVHPYGFLLGHRHYLVALRPEAGDFRSYALGNFERADMLDESFERRRDFSLAAHARRSFGVFQEREHEVRWRFRPEAAADAREYLFHPSQRIQDAPDGGLVVSFRAGGLKEMAWHLLTWGDLVEVEAPAALRDFWRLASFAAAKRRLRPFGPFA